MNTIVANQEWLARRERGNPLVIKLAFRGALAIGRRASRVFLHPIALYFLLFAPVSRRHSRRFLARVLGRAPSLLELYRHHFCFAACVLDRVFLLAGRFDLFDVSVHGEDMVLDIFAQGKGCVLLGAHTGSFEVLRAVARSRNGPRVILLMYQENARKIAAQLSSINPGSAADIIALGRQDSMLRVRDQLDSGAFIGMLADRTFDGEEQAACPFLGSPAKFPLGPFRLAKIVGRPVVMMIGLYQGGNRYEVHFERLSDASFERAMSVETLQRAYVERLERHVRSAPYNWFNFYDFWA
jgi:predicted LPLAT superfamily acyltransferase